MDAPFDENFLTTKTTKVTKNLDVHILIFVLFVSFVVCASL